MFNPFIIHKGAVSIHELSISIDQQCMYCLTNPNTSHHATFKSVGDVVVGK